ncbi:MAG: ATP synthase F0 subunit B [Bacteroidetes bacterium HGW-Bacteroidetes-21]|nr:MAG: ATP synthase F0 subunit B [Bacteroidetes bacterium HGW-Bacteroidetes-21]
MGLVTPGIGLIFWMLLAFSLVFILLKKFAWKPILKMLKDRDDHIAQSLKAADNAREEMQKLQADNENVLKEARRERDVLMQEARQIKDKIIADAKTQAQGEADKIISAARQEIEKEKVAAIQEMKTKIAEFSVDVAGKILRKELSAEAKQTEYISKLIDELNIN